MSTAILTAKPYTEIPMPEAGTPEWHELRRVNGVGASECAAVMGLSKWQSPLDIYLLKRGVVAPGESTRPMRRGNHMEPFILSEFEAETSLQVVKPAFMAKSLQYPWIYANLDGMVIGANEIVEAKSSDAPELFGESGSQDVPEYYYIQCQLQLLVTGADVCYLAAMLTRADLRIYPILPNAKLHQQIVTITSEFWQNVLDGIAPMDDASPEAVKKLYPVVEESKVIEIPAADAAALVARHKQIAEQTKALSAESDQIKARLMMLCGDAKKAKIEGWAGSLTRSMTKDTPVSFIRKGDVLFKINHPRSQGE